MNNSNSIHTVSSDLSPSLLSFLPMLYVAWADEVLSPTQLETIEAKVRKQKWLLEEEKQQLVKWLDPQSPPSAKELKGWLNAIREIAASYPENSRKTLVDLGVQIASGGKGINERVSPEAVKALKELEEVLEMVDQDIMGEMVMSPIRPEVIDTEEVQEKASFDTRLMARLLDGDQAEIKRKMRLILADPQFALQHFEQKAVYREQVLSWCKKLAQQGMGAIAYPKAYGGKGDMLNYSGVFEMLAYHDISLAIKFGVQFGLWGGSVDNLGTEYHHRKYLKEIGTLDIPGCFAMTEANHGSNVRDLETTATYDPLTKEFIIHTPHYHAHKEYIGNAAVHGKMASVFAQLYTEGECYGVHAFIVPIRDEEGNPAPGVRIEDSGSKLGLNGVDNGRLWFDQVRVPRENLLDRFGQVSEDGTYSSPIASESRRFFTMLSTLVGGRVCVPIAGLSASKKALAIAIKYANHRRQFGKEGEAETLIMDYPTHQRRLIPRLAKAYALDFAHKYVLDRFVNRTDDDIREIEALAAGLKAYSTWSTSDTIQECREACGGNGYLWVNQFASLKADTDIFTTFEGDNTVLLQLVAKGRLSEFKHRFSSMNLFGFVRYFGGKAFNVISEKNPIVTRITDEDHLRSSEFHFSAFTYREEALVSSAASRLKHRLDNGVDSYQAFLETQTHLVTMAEAYVERVVLQSFQEAISKVEDDHLKAMLEKLCTLYALSTIEEHKGWYLESNYIESSKAKAIRGQVDKLCAELRPDSVALVDAFHIPEECLFAPIAVEK